MHKRKFNEFWFSGGPFVEDNSKRVKQEDINKTAKETAVIGDSVDATVDATVGPLDPVDLDDVCIECREKEKKENCNCTCDSFSDSDDEDDEDNGKQYRFHAEAEMDETCENYKEGFKKDVTKSKFDERANRINSAYFNEIYAELRKLENRSSDDDETNRFFITSDVMTAKYNLKEHFNFMGEIAIQYEYQWKAGDAIPLPCLRCSTLNGTAKIVYVLHPDNQCPDGKEKQEMYDEEYNRDKTIKLFNEMAKQVKEIWILWMVWNYDEEHINEDYLCWIPEEVIEDILHFVALKDDDYFETLNWEEDEFDRECNNFCYGDSDCHCNNCDRDSSECECDGKTDGKCHDDADCVCCCSICDPGVPVKYVADPDVDDECVCNSDGDCDTDCKCGCIDCDPGVPVNVDVEVEADADVEVEVEVDEAADDLKTKDE